MNRLNVFSDKVAMYYPWKYIRNLPKNIESVIRRFKWAYQRITKGYANCDLWNLDHYLAKLIASAVRELAETGMGFPGDEEFPTEESWEEYLKTIADFFEMYLDDELFNVYEEDYLKMIEEKGLISNGDMTPEEEELFHNYIEVEKENAEFRSEALHGAVERLNHIWEGLWD